MRTRSNNFRLLDLPSLIVDDVLKIQFDVVSFAQCSRATRKIVQNLNIKARKFTIRHTEHRHYVSFRIDGQRFIWEFVENEEQREQIEQHIASTSSAETIDPPRSTLHKFHLSTNPYDDTENFRTFAMSLFPKSRARIFQITPLGLPNNFRLYYQQNITSNPDLRQIVLADDDIIAPYRSMKLSKFADDDFRFAVQNTPENVELDIVGCPEQPEMFSFRHETLVLYACAPFLSHPLVFQIDARECLVLVDETFKITFPINYLKRWLRFEIGEHMRELHVVFCVELTRALAFSKRHFDCLPVSEEHRREFVWAYSDRVSFDLLRSDGKTTTVAFNHKEFRLRIWD